MTPRTETRAELLAALPEALVAVQRAGQCAERDPSLKNLAELRVTLAAAERHIARIAVSEVAA